MFKTLAKWAAISAIALALVLGGSAIGRAVAQDPEPTAESTAQPTNPGTTAQPHGRGRGGRNRDKGGLAGKGLKMALLKQTVELTGLDQKDVVQQLRAGGSLTAIATANGSTEQAVIDAALAQITTRLDTAVSNGRITEAEKNELLSKARENAPTLMNETGSADLAGPGGRGDRGRHQGQHNGRQWLVQATAEVTGLTPAEVRAEVQSGKSLEQVAQAHGKTADDIMAALRTRGEDVLNQQLERAREALTQVPEK
jgi:hypothetical protein